MQFSSLIMTFSFVAIAQYYAKLEAASADKNDDITTEQIDVTHYGLLYLSQDYDFPFPGQFSNLKDFSGKYSRECVLEGVLHVALDAMIRIGKEYDFEGKHAELMRYHLPQSSNAEQEKKPIASLRRSKRGRRMDHQILEFVDLLRILANVRLTIAFQLLDSTRRLKCASPRMCRKHFPAA